MSTCQLAVSLELMTGGRFEVCQELFKFYIKGNKKYLEPRYLIDKNKGKFRMLERKNQKKYLALKLPMQSSSFKHRSFDKWKSHVNRLEEIHSNDTLIVTAADVDMNNNGKVNKVISTSRKSRRFNMWNNVNYVVDENNNLNRDFFSYGTPTTSTGELFLFDGRTFAVIRMPDNVNVIEHLPYPTDSKTGLLKRGEICLFR